MPWDIKKDLTLSLDGDTAVDTTTEIVLQQAAEKFPLVQDAIAEDNAKTFAVDYEYSVDNETWVTLLQAHATGVNGDTAQNDLSTVNNKPSGAPYLKVKITASAALGAGETATLTFTTASWVDAIHGGVTRA